MWSGEDLGLKIKERHPHFPFFGVKKKAPPHTRPAVRKRVRGPQRYQSQEGERGGGCPLFPPEKRRLLRRAIVVVPARGWYTVPVQS